MQLQPNRLYRAEIMVVAVIAKDHAADAGAEGKFSDRHFGLHGGNEARENTVAEIGAVEAGFEADDEARGGTLGQGKRSGEKEKDE
jgi:hypothetical protein